MDLGGLLGLCRVAELVQGVRGPAEERRPGAGVRQQGSELSRLGARLLRDAEGVALMGAGEHGLVEWSHAGGLPTGRSLAAPITTPIRPPLFCPGGCLWG